MNPFPFLRPAAAACCLLSLLLPVPHSNAAAFNPAASDYTSLALIRGKQNQLLLRLPVDDKRPYIVLDTGSPITCVDESKSKMFNLVSTSENGSAPESVMVNGMRHRMAIAPSLIFGPLQTKNLPVVLIDLGSLNQMLKAHHDHPNDAILGLDTMHALHAVIDCGTGRLLLPNSSQSANNLEVKLKQAGWTEIPMHVDQGHLVLHGSVNRISLDFVVDTGSPVSVLDQAFCRSHHITLTDQSFSLRAIHFETGGAKVGKVADMKIGKLDINRTLVAVFDVTSLLRGQTGSGNSPLGLLGSRTLARTQAYIDCENSRLYLKVPPATPQWGF